MRSQSIAGVFRSGTVAVFILLAILVSKGNATTINPLPDFFLDNRAGDTLFGINGEQLIIGIGVSDELGVPTNIANVTAEHTASGNTYNLSFNAVEAPAGGTSGSYIITEPPSFFPVSDRTGFYQVTATNLQGESVSSVYFPGIEDLRGLNETVPLAIPQNVLISGDPLAPTVTSTVVDNADGYNLKIYDDQSSLVYNSPITYDSPSVAVPSDVLMSGADYTFSFRALDFNSGLKRRSVQFLSYSTEPAPTQVIYLDFTDAPVTLAFDPLTALVNTDGTDFIFLRRPEFAAPSSYLLPGESLEEATTRYIEELRQLVQADFEPYNVEVTTERPGAGDYSTIFMTAGRTNTSSLFPFISPTTTGIAQHVDIFDNDPNDDAIVLIDNFRASQQSPSFVAETVSHEAGHLLGLVHVIDPANQEIMQQGIYDNLEFTDRDLRTVAWSSALQNSDCSLRNKLGLPQQNTCPDFLERSFGWSIFNVSNPIYDLILGFVFPESDALPSFIEIGLVTPSDVLGLDIPIGVQQFYLLGSSEPGGRTDVFAAHEFLDVLRPTNIDRLLYDFSSFELGDTVDIDLYKLVEGDLVEFGGASVLIARIPTPTPVSLSVVGVLVLVIAGKRSRVKKHVLVSQ